MRHPSFRRPGRAGFTLVEMLVVMTIFTFLLATVSVALATLWRAQADVQNELQRSAIITRLARQLHSDGHLAQSALFSPTADDPVPTLRLTGPDWHVEYTLEAERIVRIAYSGDQVTHREVYPLPAMKVVAAVTEETPRVLTLSIGSHEQVEVAIGLLSGATP